MINHANADLNNFGLALLTSDCLELEKVPLSYGCGDLTEFLAVTEREPILRRPVPTSHILHLIGKALIAF